MMLFNLNPNLEWLDLDDVALNPDKTYKLSDIIDDRYSTSDIEPILLDSKNLLIDGYKRYLLFVRMGEKRIPINRQRKTDKIKINMPNKNSNHCLSNRAA